MIRALQRRGLSRATRSDPTPLRGEVMPKITNHTAGTNAEPDPRLKQLGLTKDDDDWADRYLLCEHIVDPGEARSRQRFEAIARFIRDLVRHRWGKTRSTRAHGNP